MKETRLLLLFILVFASAKAQVPAASESQNNISYVIDPHAVHLRFFWRDDMGQILGSIKNLKSYAEQTDAKLLFAMNGGMYKPDHSPQGLYIENKRPLSPVDTTTGKGNFYLKPNGIFYLTVDGGAAICKTELFVNKGNVTYATQSGPMLIADGVLNSVFKKGSENLNIRNGVGILPDGKVVFIMSKTKINFYDFAMCFKNMGCKDALYLDGFVSRTYLPAKNWIQTDGDFGVMIGVVDK